MDLLRLLLAPAFMPHGHCYFWQPSMVWTQVVSNLVIFASYTSISITLWMLTRRLRAIPFGRAYFAFGLFIVLCGMTHFMDVVTVWRGVYWIDATVRVGTAVASAATAVWLVPLFPRVVAFGELVGAEKEQSRVALQNELERSRELQRALTTREREIRELVDNLPDLAWSARPDGHIEFYNRRWYEYTGTTPEQMEGWGWKSVHDPALVDDVVRQWQASLSSGAAFEMEFPLRAADGSYRWFLTRVRPLRAADGTITRWIGTNTDVTEIRQARATLRQSIEQRDEFITVAAHELRTPTTALTLQLERVARSVQRSEGVEKTMEHVVTAKKHSERVNRLLDDLLDVSRIALGRMDYRRDRVDLGELAREVVQRLEGRAEAAKVDLHVDARSTRTLVEGDRSRLDQVLVNLLSNALKFGAGNPVTVHVDSVDARAVLRVEDRGPGIAPEDRERIFGRFERAASYNYGGLGLGLYISRQIVEAHGGRIDVGAAEGGGSVFTVTLPLLGAAAPAA